MKLKFLDRFTSGLLVGAVFAFSVAWVLDSEVSESLKSNWVQFSTILAAIAGALIALIGPNRQIEQQNSLKDADRLRKLNASRAVLGLALHEIYEVATNRALYEIDANTSRFEKSWRISQTTQSTLTNCIENSDGVPQRILSNIPLVYQICLARGSQVETSSSCWKLKDDQAFEKLERIRRYTDWIALRSLAESMFGYARVADSNKLMIEDSRPRQKLIEFLEGATEEEDGWCYTNDPTYRKHYELVMRSSGHFTLADITRFENI